VKWKKEQTKRERERELSKNRKRGGGFQRETESHDNWEPNGANTARVFVAAGEKKGREEMKRGRGRRIRKCYREGQEWSVSQDPLALQQRTKKRKKTGASKRGNRRVEKDVGGGEAVERS